MAHELRQYQRDALDGLWQYVCNSPPERGALVVCPTASGKSLIIAEFIRRVLDSQPKARVIVLAHVRELLSQNYEEFIRQFGAKANAGIYSAGLQSRDTANAVIFAGIQSVYNRPDELGVFDVAIVDEAHLIPRSGEGRYLIFLAALRRANPNLVLVGLTATPYRLSGGFLHQGEGALFGGIAYDVSIDRLVEEGFLSPLVGVEPKAGLISTVGVATAEGDFKKDELERAAMEADVSAAVDEMCRLGAERKSWLVFATGLAHMGEILRQIEDRGISVDCVSGTTPEDVRDERIARFKRGELHALINVGVLTTGFNAPNVDMIGMLRPTKSTSLYVQTAGRGMRLSPATEKRNCLYLDFGGNIMRHGPVNRVKPKSKASDGDGPAPMKVCPECGMFVLIAARLCDPEQGGCGYEWPEREKPLHERKAAELSPLEFGPPKLKPPEPIYTYDVFDVLYAKHEKRNANGKPPTLRVDYRVNGFNRYSEWVCLEHPHGIRRRAERWWRERITDLTLPPYTIDDALKHTSKLRTPKSIGVQADGKFWRVVKYEWRTKEEDQIEAERNERMSVSSFEHFTDQSYTQTSAPTEPDDCPF